MDSPRLNKIRHLLAERREPGFHYTQICEALFRKLVKTYSGITTLPADLREALSKDLGNRVLTISPLKRQRSPPATKVLFELSDGERIEAVLMRYEKGHKALCISSQVGCACACAFCATGAIGFKRNLTADEIVDQVLFFQQQRHRIKSVSLFGEGEPLLNPYTFSALRILSDKKFFGLSQRRLSVSTVGIVPGIERLTDELPQVNIAFSLHSPFPKERDFLIPLNRTYTISQVMRALERHIQKTHRKVFVVYAVLDDYNDTPKHAQAVAELLRDRRKSGHLYHINLLRYNPSPRTPGNYLTDDSNLKQFKRMLEAAGLNVTIRQSFGLHINAACGQLFAEYATRHTPV